MKTYHDIPHDGGSNVAGQVTDQTNRLQARLATVRHTVAVMSGKGGVGKSSVTVNLAAALVQEGHAVGIMDADINGASIARMTGLRNTSSERGATGYRPAEDALGIRVMSIDLFLPDATAPVLWDAPTQHDAIAWRGLMEKNALREFLSDTEWGALDYLLIDLPPGTDKLPNLVDLLPRLSGTLVITLPTAVSHFVVGKSVTMAKTLLQTPVIGLVENMSGFVCAHCGQEEALFPGSRTEQMARDFEIPFLGAIPFDPRMALSADAGVPFMDRYHETPAAQAVRRLAAEVSRFLNQKVSVPANP